jgi:hypothetical protein
MTRNLRVLLGGAMVLAAFGVLGASGAQAAEFHCSVEPCRLTLQPDTSAPSKTAHHVITIDNTVGQSIAITCDQITGEAKEGKAVKKTTGELQFSGIVYDKCLNGAVATVIRMNGCKYLFKAAGTLTIEGCEAGKSIEIELGATGCIFTIAAQGPLGGTSYHTNGVIPNRELTVEINIKNIAVTSPSTALQCNGFHIEGTNLTGTYTTGNTIVTGEEDKAGGKMSETWWE